MYDWLEQYIKLHFSPNVPTQEEIETANKLKYKHIPRSLFRYRSFSAQNLDAFLHDYTWMSYPIEFNDPFDARTVLSFESLRNDIFRQSADQIAEALRKGGVNLSPEALEDLKQSDEFIVCAGQRASQVG